MRLLLLSDGVDRPVADGLASPRCEMDVLRSRPGVDAEPVGPHAAAALRPLARRVFDPVQVARLARKMRGRQACLALSEAVGYLLALASALLPSPPAVFIVFHGQHWWARRNRLLAAAVRRSPNVHFLPLSASVGAILTDEYGIDPTRVHVTGYGVDARFFAPAAMPGGRIVASAGTASRDYRTLAEASVRLDAMVEIAADSTWYRETLDLAQDEIPANVRVFSAGDYRGLREVYARARVIVVPLRDVRYAAGYAVIAEAMAMGKPVIVTRTQAPGDLIEHGVSGLYVPAGDAAALRDAIAALLADPARAERMGRAARAAVERTLNVESYVARIEAVIDTVAGAGRARPAIAAEAAVARA